jgi:hypothetical protein
MAGIGMGARQHGHNVQQSHTSGHGLEMFETAVKGGRAAHLKVLGWQFGKRALTCRELMIAQLSLKWFCHRTFAGDTF